MARYFAKLGKTEYTIESNHSPGVAMLTRKNADGETKMPFPSAMLGEIVRKVTASAIQRKLMEFLPAWTFDERGVEKELEKL